MISDVRKICDDKFDECHDLQKQIYDLEQTMNRIGENSNEQDEYNIIHLKNIEIGKLTKQLNEAKSNTGLNNQTEILNDINSANAEIDNIKEELEHKSIVLQRGTDNFKKFEKQTLDEI